MNLHLLLDIGLIIAALSFVEGGKVIIDDKDSVNTSFPSFLKLLKKLGAEIN